MDILYTLVMRKGSVNTYEQLRKSEAVKMFNKVIQNCDYDEVTLLNDRWQKLLNWEKKQKQTRFQRIISSPEVLAEFIADHSRKLIFDSICHREPDYEFTNEFGNGATKPDAVLTWLKQEIEE